MKNKKLKKLLASVSMLGILTAPVYTSMSLNPTAYAVSDTQTAENTFTEAVISEVTDGDTVKAVINGQTETIRMIGVNTPETKHPTKEVEYFGPEASEFTKSRLEGKTVWLEKDVSERDRYGRLLRNIWLVNPTDPDTEFKDNMFGAILISEGYAGVSTFPPDVKYQDRLVELEQTAKSEGKGLWANPEADTTTETESDTIPATTETPFPVAQPVATTEETTADMTSQSEAETVTIEEDTTVTAQDSGEETVETSETTAEDLTTEATVATEETTETSETAESTETTETTEDISMIPVINTENNSKPAENAEKPEQGESIDTNASNKVIPLIIGAGVVGLIGFFLYKKSKAADQQ